MRRDLIAGRFEKMNRLYHFTNFKAACSIIRSKQLRFGKPSNMNDLIENRKITTRRAFFGDLGKDVDKDFIPEIEMRRYQQISFAQDSIVEGEECLGFNLHTMWGLYADRGYGVCLVFDKDKLHLEEKDHARDVIYDDWIMPDYVFHNKTQAGIRAEIWRRKEEIYF